MQNKKSQPIKTVLIIVIGFVVVYMGTHQKWALWTSLIVGVMGLSSTYLSEKIDCLWIKLAYILSLVVPKILLSVIFYLFLFPLALLSRFFGKRDPMMLKNHYKSTFIVADKSFIKSSFEHPW